MNTGTYNFVPILLTSYIVQFRTSIGFRPCVHLLRVNAIEVHFSSV